MYLATKELPNLPNVQENTYFLADLLMSVN